MSDPRPNSPEDLGVHRRERVPSPAIERTGPRRPGPTPSAILRMQLGPDEAFETIAGQLLGACDKVKCTPDEYVTGLRYILGEIEVAIQAAQETMR